VVALCAQCGAPLTPADLGYTFCLTCHWQRVFEEAPPPAPPGELRLALVAATGAGPAQARDREGRIWRRLHGDGRVWCALCGETLGEGWTQGEPGWLETYVCAEHVDVRPDGAARAG